MPEIAIELESSVRSRSVTVVVSEDPPRPGGGAEGPERVGLSERSAALVSHIASVSAAAFNESLAVIPLMGDAVLDQIGSMQRRPREVEVTMCFKVGTKGTLKLVEATGEAHFQVTFRWDASPGEGSAQ